MNAFPHFADEDNSGILGRLMASLLNESSIITIDQRVTFDTSCETHTVICISRLLALWGEPESKQRSAVWVAKPLTQVHYNIQLSAASRDSVWA